MQGFSLAARSKMVMAIVHKHSFENNMSIELKSTDRKLISAPAIIRIVCTLGILGTLPSFLLWTTELAYMIGQWYLNYLLVSSFFIWLSLAGVWKMKKWGVLAYTAIVIVTETVLWKYNTLWSYISLIIPLIVTTTIWLHFKRMN